MFNRHSVDWYCGYYLDGPLVSPPRAASLRPAAFLAGAYSRPTAAFAGQADLGTAASRGPSPSPDPGRSSRLRAAIQARGRLRRGHTPSAVTADPFPPRHGYRWRQTVVV
jgi:hypothetical protein